MTCNMAYRKEALEAVGGFDERYRLEDGILALKILRRGGKIAFNPRRRVYHQKVTLNAKKFIKAASLVRAKPYLFREFCDKTDMFWRIVYPRDFVILLFPPSVVLSFFLHSYRTWEDFRLFPLIYLRAIYGRLCLWRQCMKEGVFLV